MKKYLLIAVLFFSALSPPLAQAQASLCTPTSGTIQQNVLGIAHPAFTNEDLPFLKDLGVRWVRSDMIWSDIEPAEGSYDWRFPDGLVDELAKNGIQLLALINYPPAWARAKRLDEAIKAARQFAQTIVNRYKSNVHYWEVFNEPNLQGFGFHADGEEIDVRTYYAYLSAMNRGIRSADPNAVILLGGLAPDGTSPAKFLQDLYRLGGKDCFDVIAFHPYGWKGRFDEVANEIRNIASPYGDGNKPIWFSEYGTANDLERAGLISHAATESSAVQGLFWFSLRDLKATSERYGLLTHDYNKKEPDFNLFKLFLKLQP